MKNKLEQKRKSVLKSIRESFEFFGIDTRNLTDEEIEDGCANASKVIRSAGVGTKEATEVLRSFARVGL